jgi:hypothetical protein
VSVATAMRWRVHVRSVVHTVHTWCGSVSRRSVSIIHYRIAASATGDRRFTACRKTVLRQRQRSSALEESGNNRDTFQGDHVHPPNAYATRRYFGASENTGVASKVCYNRYKSA